MSYSVSPPTAAQQRRHALLFLTLLAAATLLAGGCSSASRANLKMLGKAALDRRVDVEPSPAQVAASPYAQIKVTGPTGGAILILGNDDLGRQSWYSSDHKIVYLRDGLLIGTVGLAQDAADIRIEGDNPFAHLAQLQTPVQVRRSYDWMPGYRYGVAVSGELRRQQRENVDILGVTRALVRFEETLRGPGVRAVNEYWAEPDTGFIWKSRQLVAPGVSLDIVQLKPYRPVSR